MSPDEALYDAIMAASMRNYYHDRDRKKPGVIIQQFCRNPKYKEAFSRLKACHATSPFKGFYEDERITNGRRNIKLLTDFDEICQRGEPNGKRRFRRKLMTDFDKTIGRKKGANT